MNKPGRNEPCPCGSGIKFKHCCGDPKLPEVYSVFNLIGKQIENYILSQKRSVESIMVQVAEDVHRRATSNDEWMTTEYDAKRMRLASDAINVVSQEWFNQTSHSRHYWYPLVRSVISVFLPSLHSALLSRGMPREHANKYLLHDRTIFDLTMAAAQLVLLAAKPDTPEEWIDEEGIHGLFYAPGDLEFKTLAAIVSLAQMKDEVQGLYRFACKDIPILNKKSWTDLDYQRMVAIQDYERRRDLYQTISGSAGVWYDPLQVIEQRPELCHLWAIRGVRSKEFRFVSKNPRCFVRIKWLPNPFSEHRSISVTDSKIKPGIFKVPIGSPSSGVESLIPYDSLLDCFAASIEKALKLPAIKITTFLYALYFMIRDNIAFQQIDLSGNAPNFLIRWNPEVFQGQRDKALVHLANMAGLAMLRSSRENWVLGIIQAAIGVTATDSTLPLLTTSEIGDIVDRFTLDGPRDLDNDGPFLFTKLSDYSLVLDFIGAIDFARSLLLTINRVGREHKPEDTSDPGEETGAWLEEQAANFFERELALVREKIIFREKANVGVQSELDLAFVYRGALFMIDCKVAAKDWAYMAGEHKKIRNRLSTFTKQILEENPKRIELIRQGVFKHRIKPTDFARSYSLVCTSAVEYLPHDKKELWVGKHPLVGSPEELLVTIRHLAGE